jgi:hypothetical protein
MANMTLENRKIINKVIRFFKPDVLVSILDNFSLELGLKWRAP